MATVRDHHHLVLANASNRPVDNGDPAHIAAVMRYLTVAEVPAQISGPEPAIRDTSNQDA
jgi:hypothetical protein